MGKSDTGVPWHSRSCSHATGILSVLMLAIVVSITCGCSKKKDTDPRSLTSMVSVEGSDTMSGLLTVWSQAFMEENSGVPVSVSSADSGAGVRALLARTTDVAATSRDLTELERKEMHEKGLRLKREMVALDSIAIVVSPDNPLDEISMKSLKQIFTGDKVSWSDLAPGAEGEIVVLVREQASGTSRYFKEHVLKRALTPEDEGKKVKYSDDSRVMTSNESMIAGVSANNLAIGYTGLHFALDASERVKVLKIKLLDDSPAVMPSRKNVSDSYPLSRPLYLFLDVSPKHTVRQFVDFCLSDKGQKLAADNGYVPVK